MAVASASGKELCFAARRACGTAAEAAAQALPISPPFRFARRARAVAEIEFQVVGSPTMTTMLLTHSGLMCPVGIYAAAACAAMRAGIAGFGERPYLDNAGQPVIGAAVPGLAPNLPQEERLLTLLEGALRDCLKSAAMSETISIPLMVGLSELGRPGGCDHLASGLISKIEKRLKLRFHPTLSRCLSRGHTSGFELLKDAREILADPNVPGCLVAGVDSYMNARTLNWLSHLGRLKAEGNSDGVIPGEAAAVVLIRQSATPDVAGTTRFAGLGFAQEDAGILSPDPLMGLGLAAALKAALQEAGMQMNQIGFRILDVTGESYGFKEQSLALSRVLRNGPSQLPMWHCADSIGDVGAAAGICQWIVADYAFRKNYAPGNSAICTASAVAGGRAAAVLSRQ